MSMDRRAFLSIVAGSPLIFGLREIFAQEPDTRPEWFRKALEHMKERKLHGVVIVVPEADPQQLEFGRCLWKLLEDDYPEAHELFLAGAFIFMTPAMAAAGGVRKAARKENRVLLHPRGK